MQLLPQSCCFFFASLLLFLLLKPQGPRGQYSTRYFVTEVPLAFNHHAYKVEVNQPQNLFHFRVPSQTPHRNQKNPSTSARETVYCFSRWTMRTNTRSSSITDIPLPHPNLLYHLQTRVSCRQTFPQCSARITLREEEWFTVKPADEKKTLRRTISARTKIVRLFFHDRIIERKFIFFVKPPRVVWDTKVGTNPCPGTSSKTRWISVMAASRYLRFHGILSLRPRTDDSEVICHVSHVTSSVVQGTLLVILSFILPAKAGKLSTFFVKKKIVSATNRSAVGRHD